MRNKSLIVFLTLLVASCTSSKEVYFAPNGEMVGWKSVFEEGVDSSKSGSQPSKYHFKYYRNNFSLSFSISYLRSTSDEPSPVDLQRPLSFMVKVRGDNLVNIEPSNWVVTNPDSTLSYKPVKIVHHSSSIRNQKYINVTYSLIPENVNSLIIDFGEIRTKKGVERVPLVTVKRVEGKTRTAQFTL